MDSMRRTLRPETAKPHNQYPTPSLEGTALDLALAGQEPGGIRWCAVCGTPSLMVQAPAEEIHDMLPAGIATGWKETVRESLLCMLCSITSRPELLRAAAASSHVWFLAAHADAKGLDASISQAELNHQHWSVISEPSLQRRKAARDKLRERMATLPAQKIGGKTGLAPASELFSQAERQFLTQHVQAEFGIRQENVHPGTWEHVALGMWAVPLLLAERARRIAVGEPAVGIAPWAGRERVMLTEAGVEYLVAWSLRYASEIVRAG